MRYLKRLLICLYVYDGAFFAACLICNICGITIQDSLIAGVAAATGVESIIGGIIKVKEALDERKKIELGHKLKERSGGNNL